MFQINNKDTRPEQRQLFIGKYGNDQLVPKLSRSMPYRMKELGPNFFHITLQ